MNFDLQDTLYIIPARGGSKGIPRKNIKLLNGRPLLFYTIDYARNFVDDRFICMSSDDDEIIRMTNDYGLSVPFKRPGELAKDNSGSKELVHHALEFYAKLGTEFDKVVLLQPTSPLRKIETLTRALEVYNPSLELVVSVQKLEHHPYYGVYEESEEGYLSKFVESNINRRQDLPQYFVVNGAFYIFNVDALSGNRWVSDFSKIVKIEMPKSESIDLDNEDDWEYCEFLIRKRNLWTPQ